MVKLNGNFKGPEYACEYFEYVMCQGLLSAYMDERQCMEWTEWLCREKCTTERTVTWRRAPQWNSQIHANFTAN